MSSHPLPDEIPAHGGLAQYFVTRKEVGWAAFVAVLLWGWFAYGTLAQQEDPLIPQRQAVLVTQFPGASVTKIDELVTKKLEDKIGELQSIDELQSGSRAGASGIKISVHPGSETYVNQQWDKIRAKVQQVQLPEGCYPPTLDTDFGDTITLLFAVTSPPISEAECQARAHLVRTRLGQLRKDTGASGRAAVVAFFPPEMSLVDRNFLIDRFLQQLKQEAVGTDAVLSQGESIVMADFATKATKARIEDFIGSLAKALTGTRRVYNPDFATPLVLMADEDPLPQIRAAQFPRYSYRQLRKMAETFNDEVKQVSSVGRVSKIGVVQEAVHLYYSQRAMGYPLDFDQVTGALQARNAIIPSGTLHTQGQDFPVQLSGEFKHAGDLLDTIVGQTNSGSPVYLRDVCEMERSYEDPLPFTVDVMTRNSGQKELTPKRSVLLAVQMKEGSIIHDFNTNVMNVVAKLKNRLPDDVSVFPISDQPEEVSHRIHLFVRCLGEAILVVIAVALLLMNWRSALIVALAIPLTIAMTLGGMSLLSVPLHQISIGALIISLGMLVDDPVVAADAINRELAEGKPRDVASWLGPHKLRRPILFGTIINIFAFLPLLLVPGDDGAFIIALPIVVTLALAASRLVSMTFIPLLGYYVLRGQKGLEHGGEVRGFPPFSWVDRLMLASLPRYRRVLELGIAHPFVAVIVAYGILALSLTFVPLLGTEFFPPAESNKLVIDVHLPESTSPLETRQTCAEIVKRLQNEPAIENATVFIGGSAPRFYYNVEPKAPGSNIAAVLINVRSEEDVVPLMVKLRDVLDREIAGARCLVKQLVQGPPVDAPIQIRLLGEDLDVLRGLADQVSIQLRAAGAYKVHDTLEQRTPTLVLDVSQDRANTLGVNNARIGQVSRAAFSGLRATDLRDGDYAIPVLIQLRIDERNTVEQINNLYVESVNRQAVPLSSFATLRIQPEYMLISRFNQMHSVNVNAFAPHGELAANVLGEAKPSINRIDLPPGYRLEYAGEDKQLGDSQKNMTRAMGVSMALIALALIVQFHAVTKASVILLAVPLGLIGALTGLLLTNSPLGFMALLALVSLAGVIVSHIIVLSDYIEEGIAAGMKLEEALVQAGLVRLRPVLVTVLATVGALIPLFESGGALWRPLAAVHIFGLLFATMLTLVILPVLYYLFARVIPIVRE
ncbi:MAG: efflux RND transporter permease subunit [Gemmataceae bacterium]|nr:efflux RND transporter permease subunit [Gemmataceae bacterium]